MAPHIAANVTKALTKVVNHFAAPGAAEYCVGANLFAANKKD